MDETPDSGTPNEPPEWWKRWHPLRWLAAATLILLLLLARSCWQRTSKPPPPRPGSPAVVATDVPCLICASYTAPLPDAQRLEFPAPFRSSASVDEAAGLLTRAGYAPRLQSHHAQVPDEVPPHDLDIIRVDGFRHLGQPGKLELQFFNNRLYQLEFEPSDAEAYRQQFRRQWPLLGRGPSGRGEQLNGPLRIASSLDLSVSEVGRVLDTRPFVLWQDLRLLRQRDEWNERFAKVAG